MTIVILWQQGVLLYVRMFLRTFYEKIHAETSVQLGSDILVLLKCFAGRRGSMTFFTAFCDIKSWNSTRNPYKFVSIASVLKTKVSGKQSHCHTPYSRFNSVDGGHLLIKDYQPTKFEASGAKHSRVISCTKCGRLTLPLTLTFGILT